jgi:hypothetical protein
MTEYLAYKRFLNSYCDIPQSARYVDRDATVAVFSLRVKDLFAEPFSELERLNFVKNTARRHGVRELERGRQVVWWSE